MCGEHDVRVSSSGAGQGSSPHVRGTPKRLALNRAFAGIIPACAGNTPATALSASRSRDHPRMCGEHHGSSAWPRSCPGSSPHVRGTPVGLGGQGQERGIIPACAGNTMTANSMDVTARDHPRMCGEHTKKIAQYQRYRKR